MGSSEYETETESSSEQVVEVKKQAIQPPKQQQQISQQQPPKPAASQPKAKKKTETEETELPEPQPLEHYVRTRPAPWWETAAQKWRYGGAVPSRADDEQEPVVPKSGAHVLYTDLAKDPKAIPYPIRTVNDVIAGEEPEQLKPNMGGWVGTPDPTKYAPNTTYLSSDEYEEEMQKGNIMPIVDVLREIDNAPQWKRDMIEKILAEELLRKQLWIPLDDGRVISFADAYDYVHNNPELEALARRNMVMDTMDGKISGADRFAHLDPRKQEALMQHGIVATGEIWQRRPTRWLKGLDGVKNADFNMYVHEKSAQKELGQYTNRPWYDVVDDPEYQQEIIRRGPIMGVTFMMAAARELPAYETRDALTTHLAKRMESSNLTPENQDSLNLLHETLNPLRLSEQTKLLDIPGRNLRMGSTVMLTTGPHGTLLIEGITPSTDKEQERYILGVIRDSTLCYTLLDSFLGEKPIDQDFCTRARISLLQKAHGFDVDYFLNERDAASYVFGAYVRPTVPSMFRLPPVGGSRERTSKLVVHGITDTLNYMKLQTAFSAALQSTQSNSGTDSVQRALEGQLSHLGLNVQGLDLALEPTTLAHLADNAEPLTEDVRK